MRGRLRLALLALLLGVGGCSALVEGGAGGGRDGGAAPGDAARGLDGVVLDGAAPADQAQTGPEGDDSAAAGDDLAVVDAAVAPDLAVVGPVCTGAQPGPYCGNDSVQGGDANTLYQCPGKGMAPSSSQACANGCQVQPMGMSDFCKGGLSCPGAGDYCGGDGVQGGDANTLYHCNGAGQAPAGQQGCPNGCAIKPQGVPDVCANGLSCPGAGDYCGNDGVGGPANVLYHCNGKGGAPASSTPCAGGCVVKPPGTPDVCAQQGQQGCPQLGQAALAWEANQLAGGHCWCSMCLGFVNNAFAVAGNSPGYLHLATANASLAAARATGRFVPWNGACPCGAILYWEANNCNQEDGHVVICNGDGTVSTSGWNGYAGATHASIAWLDGMECGHTPAGYLVPP